ncbi:MAG: serine/threonine-protein kinase, partial [Burkholderiales bacterium]
VEVIEAERESFNALFLNEARAAAGLSHPHIVTVFDAGISDDRAYIAMELLKGRDLRQLRQEGWRATPAQAALIVRRVADALGYAHSKGVVHRDVKPANIFMIGRTQPKVLDFGIARIAHQHDAQQTGDIAAGSPYYMAPEQARHEQVDRRADVFSLGVVLYELLTDLKPFRGNTLDEITTAVLKHDPPLANVIDASVPEALAQITAKALAKNPDHRYRSARAFSRELRHWLDENTISSDGDLQVGPGRRVKPLWIGMAAIGALGLGALVWTTLGAHRVAAPSPAPGIALAAASAPAAVPTPLSAPTPAPVASVTSGGIVIPEQILVLSPAAGPAASAAAEPASAAAVTPATPKASVSAKDLKPASPKETPKETPKQKRAREAREREARGAAATPAAAVSAPTGTLRIAISPWGEVEVDGRRMGTSPPLTELSLPAGRHQVVLRNTDLPAYSTTVNVTADQPVTLKHKF